MRVLAVIVATLALSGCVVGGGFVPTFPNPNLPSNFGSTSLSGGFTHTVSVVSGGSIDAAVVGPNCRGFISTASDFTLNLTTLAGGPGLLPLVITTQSASDTTLVVYDPFGNWYCDDDGGPGLNARIQLNNPAQGAYKIWVGSYGGGNSNATLRIN